MEYVWNINVTSMGCHGQSLGYPGICMEYHGISRDIYGIAVGYLWNSCGISIE